MTRFARKIDTANNKCDDVIRKLAATFHADFIVPFCENHNLRFWSGNGTWFFESIAGRQLHPEDHLMKWAHATGNSTLDPRRHRFEAAGQLTCDDEDIPEFFRQLLAIEEFLSSEVMGSPLGYSVCDFRTEIPCTRNFSFNERTRI